MKKRTETIRLGFTLLEILVVAVVAAMLAGVALRTYSKSYKSRKLEQYACDIKSSAAYARCVAVERGQKYNLIISKANNSFLICDEPKEKDEQANIIDNQYCSPVEMEDFIEVLNVSVNSRTEGMNNKSGICFYPDGTADSAVITLRCYERFMTLFVSPSTGKVSLHKGKARFVPQRPVDLDDM